MLRLTKFKKLRICRISFSVLTAIAVSSCMDARSADEVIFVCTSQTHSERDFISILDKTKDGRLSFKNEGEMKLHQANRLDEVSKEMILPNALPIWAFLKSKKRAVPIFASNFGLKVPAVRVSFFYYEKEKFGVEFADIFKRKLEQKGFRIVSHAELCTPV